MFDRIHELKSIEDVDDFIEHYQTGAFFKKDATSKSSKGLDVVKNLLNKREQIHLGIIDIEKNPEVSHYLGELTGIIHKTPQFILLVEKHPVYDADNWNIAPGDLEQALHAFLD